MPKKMLFAFFAAVVVAGGLFWYYRSAEAYAGSITVYQGSAELRQQGKTLPGKTGTKVRIGDTLSVAPGGRISIVLKDGSQVRLEAGTTASIAKIDYDPKNRIRAALFRLQDGKIWSRIEPLSQNGNFRVETPTIIASVRGTAFNTTYTPEKTGIRVYQHSVRAALQTNPAEEIGISEGQKMIISNSALEEGFARGPEVLTAEDTDDWTTFNLAEDLRIYGKNDLENSDMASPSPSPGTSASASAPASPEASSLSSSPTPLKSSPPKLASPLPVITPTVISSPLPTASPGSANKTISSLSLMPMVITIPPAEPMRLQVVATYTDGSTADVTGIVTWTQQPIIGTIAASREEFTGTSEGQTRIKATLNGKTSNEILITVANQKTLTSLAVSCKKLSGAATYQQFTQAQCAAEAVYSDGSAVNITNQASWIVFPNGSAKGSISTTGLYSAGAFEGNDTIQASFDGQSGTFSLQVP